MSARLHALANPARFGRFARRALPWMAWLAALCIGIGAVWGLVFAPPGATPPEGQGETVRIIYVHVPAAWMSLFIYSFMAGAAVITLIWRIKLAECVMTSCAPIGASFTALALVTGMLWGKPMWGAYWVWDPRLTSELVLLFLYFGYMGLRAGIEDPVKADKASAMLAVVGVINVPIIKFSVEWWTSLHQAPTVMQMGKPKMDSAMLWPLLLMFLAFALYFIAVLLIRLRAELLRRERNASWVREVLT